MDLEIRSVIHYFYLNVFSISTAANLINGTYGEGTITPNGVKYWYKQFAGGRTHFDDASRPGRPTLKIDPNAVLSILNEYPFASARFIAQELQVNCGKIINVLKLELGLTKKHARWVPHFLTN